MNICEGNICQQCSDNTDEFKELIVEIKGIVEIPFLHRLESLEMVALSVINDAECLGRMFS